MAFDPQLTRRQFLMLGLGLEAGLVVAAGLLAWFVDIDLSRYWRWSTRDALVGVAAALPLFAVFWVAAKSQFGPFAEIQKLLVNGFGPVFGRCSLGQLACLALSAGVGEEVLFRGVLQPWFERLHPIMGWVGSAVLFGLCHAVTLLYFVLATLFGLLFSALMLSAEHAPLLIPIVTHAVYDFLAFWFIRNLWLAQPAQMSLPPVDDSLTSTTDVEPGQANRSSAAVSQSTSQSLPDSGFETSTD